MSRTIDRPQNRLMKVQNPSKKTAKVLLEDWSRSPLVEQQSPKETARRLMNKYGPPDEATLVRFIWFENDPWKRTEVHHTGPRHGFPVPHIDHLHQYIDYRVPPEKYEELCQYDGNVYIRPDRNELAATCDTEEANILTLNLVHDIVTGKKTVEEANDAHIKLHEQLTTDETQEYATELQFQHLKSQERDSTTKIIAKNAERNAYRLAFVGLALSGIVYYIVRRIRDGRA